MRVNCALTATLALAAPGIFDRAIGEVPVATESTVGWYKAYIQDSQQIRLRDGRTLNLYCIGAGSPTVILEAGIGGGAYDWRSVQSRLGQQTRVCAYDRAGVGRSPTGPFPRDTRAQVADLEALLSAAKVRPPYVLVGHSMGAFNARLYATRHKRDVAGIVLVDPSVEDQIPLLYAAAPSIRANDQRQMNQLRACADVRRTPATAANCTRSAPEGFPADLAAKFAEGYGRGFYETVLSEAESFIAVASRQMKAEPRNLGSIPLIVLTRGKRSNNLPANEAEAEWHLVKEMHARIAGLSRAGSHRVVEGADHYIQLEKPDAVLSAVAEVIRRTKSVPK